LEGNAQSLRCLSARIQVIIKNFIYWKTLNSSRSRLEDPLWQNMEDGCDIKANDKIKGRMKKR